MKKLLWIVLCLTLISGICLLPVGAAAEDGVIKVMLNAKPLNFDQNPVLENGRTLVPMRAIFEALGAQVNWIEESQTIIAEKDGNIFTLQIGNTTAFKNSESVQLDVAPMVVNDRTLVPVRYIAESLGATVNWEESTQTVSIVEAGRSIPMVQIEMENGGVIVLELYPQYAPQTVANFLKLAGDGFYDGLGFHRVIPGFMIQGGDPEGNGMGGSDANIPGEFAQNGFAQNTLLHTRGVISMARSMDPNSASSQFFIVHGDASFLDGAYAAFGKVTKGMEVVDAIAATPVLEGGEGSTPKEMPKMKQVRVLPEQGIFTGELASSQTENPMKVLGERVKAVRAALDAESVAVAINGETISKKEFETYYLWAEMSGMTEDQTLEQLVSQKVLSGQAIKEGIQVTNEEIDNIILSNRQYLMENPLDSVGFYSYLEGAGITEEQYWQESQKNYRDSLLINKLSEKLYLEFTKNNAQVSGYALEQAFAQYAQEYEKKLRDAAQVVVNIKLSGESTTAV